MLKSIITIIIISFSFGIQDVYAQERLGMVIDNTNKGLPEAYGFKEYVFPEPNDQIDCRGISNPSASLAKVFFSQTHRLDIESELFFLVGERPALLQLAIEGQGISPDVSVEGFINGESLGKMCINGPSELSMTVDHTIPDFTNYFSITIPKEWLLPSLKIEISIGEDKRILSSDELKIGKKTELNLVILDLDFMDYNFEEHRTPIFENFLQEIASAIPASVIRLGRFPETIVFPEVAASSGEEEIIRLLGSSEVASKEIPDLGNINALAASFISNFHRSSNDYLTTVYFGNTLNLDPGGWGGGNSFVSFDFTDVTIHELGHALSLPHWRDNYGIAPDRFQYLYPYAGISGAGDGRGESWNFNQDLYEFIDPICRTDENRNGNERSDAMQRNNTCLELRKNGSGPWDGFGDFSAAGMHQYLIGGLERNGMVSYNGSRVPFQLSVQSGFPDMVMQNGKRVYSRDSTQQTEFLQVEEFAPLPGEEKLNQDVYLVYGSAHESQASANIVYKPIKYKGTLPPLFDPTKEETIKLLKEDRVFLDRLGGPKDIVVRLTYEDGSILHLINPYHGYERGPWNGDGGAFRFDHSMWSLVVPADKELIRVEQFNRPLIARGENEIISGNIRNPTLNITADNFMDAAQFQAEYFKGQPLKPGLGTIGNKVWHDLNQNGINEENEPGIPGVKILLWTDSDGDGIPDSEGYSGFSVTNENGEYLFTGLQPGNYIAFVWFLENYDIGGPLNGMVPTAIFSDPNTDIDLDNNGRRGGGVFPGLDFDDIASGIIELSTNNEPLNDGDRIDEWFDYDVSGNRTIDFGFYVDGASSIKETLGANISVFPNPAQSFISVETNDFSIKTIEIYNITGEFITSQKENFDKIDISFLHEGIFILNVFDSKSHKVHRKKFLKY